MDETAGTRDDDGQTTGNQTSGDLVTSASRTGGQVAFEAYSLASGGRSLVSGDELRGWADLPETIQGAWEAAADAVRAQEPAQVLVSGSGGLRLGKPGAGSPAPAGGGDGE